MLKGRRTKKAYPQILDRLNFDDKIESKEGAEAQLDEAVKEVADSGFDDIFADDNLFGDFDDIFEQENDFSSSDWSKTKPVDLDRPLDPYDPFATGRGARGDASDLDRLKSALDAYIKVAKSPFILHSTNHLSEAEALRHIVVYLAGSESRPFNSRFQAVGMKTSLPADAALYHASAKIFSRSKGRSSVAAAAYRSGTRLTDRRTGETFDYRNKGHVITSFIVAPTNAPAWAFDREELWNRAEAAERKSNATVAREWEVSIPRDIPINEWENFARQAVQPWIEANAIADIAIHCPLDQYAAPQPHIHVLLTTRKLDPATDSGFSKKKNDDLRKMHESGGKDGAEGKFGDALKSERERLANIMNEFLDRAGSPRRVSHLTNAARYADSVEIPEPEPTMGEQRVSTARRRKKGDYITDEVAQHRSLRAMKTALTTTEEEIMSDYPRMQSEKNGVRPKHQQDYKQRLMSQRLPGVDVRSDDLYMIDVKDPRKTRIQMRDGGWVEVENRKVTIYGPHGMADKLGAAIISADHADHVDRLPETAAITKRGQKPRQRQQATPSGDIPANYKLPETAIESIADKWRSRGYINVIEAPDGVYVTMGLARLQDLGTEVRIHGKPSDPAINALLAKAADEWGGELEAYGSQEFKDRLWLEAQRQGVKVFDQSGQPYEPSPAIRAQFEADRAKLDAQVLDLEGIKQRKKVSDLMLEAANGSKDALTDLRERDYHLWLLLTNFDEDQLSAFKAETVESIESQLDGFRAVGRDLEADAGTPESASQAPSPDDEPEPKKTKQPQPA